MKPIFVLMLSLLTINAYSSVCTDVLDDSIVEIANCRLSNQNKKCPELQNQYESLSTLSLARHLLKLPEAINVETVVDLRGEDIISFLKENDKAIKGSLLFYAHRFNASYGSNGPRAAAYSNQFYSNVIHFADENYQDYFLRYVRILNREIPWAEIRNLEKGLSLGELTSSLNDLSQNKCQKMMKRYGFRISWKDVMREALDNHFKNILEKAKN